MSRLKHSVNSPHTKPWIERIGKIVLNFSVLELESIHWLVQLSEESENIKQFVETPFAARVSRLMKHVDNRSINAKWRKASLRAWNDSLKLAIVRNQVAHNPIVFGWHNPAEIDEPDFIFIPNLRGSGSINKEWSLSKTTADKCTNDIVAVVQKLAELRSEWCRARDDGNAPSIHIKPTPWTKLKQQIKKTLRIPGIRNT